MPVLDSRAITGTERAYTYARAGIARSGATRSGYVVAFTTVDLITRDETGAIVSRIDLVPYIRHGSLQVSQALNDEPDTCSFQIVPTAPASAVPRVGQEIIVAWTAGDPVFQGYALVVQFDRRAMNESPWVSVQCQDSMWRFDARIVTIGFPSQSITASIAALVHWFCNDPDQPSPNDFTVDWVQPDMPTIPAFDVINERPSTVLRRLTATVGGAFNVIGRDVHAWAGSLSEPFRTAPVPLTNDLPTLKSFRLTHDATQLRKRVLVEGRRTSTLIPLPAMGDKTYSTQLGVPLADAQMFTVYKYPVPANWLTRFGSQWMYVKDPYMSAPLGGNAPQSTVAVAYTPGGSTLTILKPDALPLTTGWIRVSGQFTRYTGYSVAADKISLTVPTAGPYAVLTAPIPVGTQVDWVDSVMYFEPHGLSWTYPDGVTTPGDLAIRAAPPDTPVVTLAEADRPLEGWPPIEGFVQDGRYRFDGALNRANTDLDAFSQPLVTAEWETEDTNAFPGRTQVIALTGESVIDPLNMTVTITHVDITFPLRTLPPRRQCRGGDVKPSTFIDLVLTDES